MKYLKKIFESSDEESIVLDLKDMSLDLNDSGFNIEVFEDTAFNTGNIVVKIVHNKRSFREYFKMTPLLKEFIFRITDYMKDNGYEYDTHSNYGRLYLTNDDRIILSSGEVRENRPPFTMINITFKK
jgi:hypothetical protein